MITEAGTGQHHLGDGEPAASSNFTENLDKKMTKNSVIVSRCSFCPGCLGLRPKAMFSEVWSWLVPEPSAATTEWHVNRMSCL